MCVCVCVCEGVRVCVCVCVCEGREGVRVCVATESSAYRLLLFHSELQAAFNSRSHKRAPLILALILLAAVSPPF